MIYIFKMNKLILGGASVIGITFQFNLINIQSILSPCSIKKPSICPNTPTIQQVKTERFNEDETEYRRICIESYKRRRSRGRSRERMRSRERSRSRRRNKSRDPRE
jgi:hypothetical protein